MDRKEKDGEANGGGRKGALYIVGIGPCGLEELTGRAREVLSSAECIVGYTRYVELISPLIRGKEVYSTGMTQEVERCRKAIGLAGEGKTVAIVSSGDAGIYGMAGLALELAPEDRGFTVETVPGVPAFVSAASILGAPLMHDFASISLSDLLTPWAMIEKRIEAAAKGDFVIILYNPKSKTRVEGLSRAMDIIRRCRDKNTPAGIVRNAARQGEEAVLTTVGEMERHYDMVDMQSIVIVGNSATFRKDGWIITPRGYKLK